MSLGHASGVVRVCSSCKMSEQIIYADIITYISVLPFKDAGLDSRQLENCQPAPRATRLRSMTVDALHKRTGARTETPWLRHTHRESQRLKRSIKGSHVQSRVTFWRGLHHVHPRICKEHSQQRCVVIEASVVERSAAIFVHGVD